MAWQAAVGFSFAALSFAMGVAFRAGHFPPGRRRSAWYHDFYRNDALGRWQRNYLSGAIPFGLGFGCAMAAATLAPSPDTASTAEIALMLVALASFVVAAVFMFWNPRFVKPRWLVEAEEGRAHVPDDTHPPPAWAARASWALLACGAVVAWHFGELSTAAGPILIGASYTAALSRRGGRTR